MYTGKPIGELPEDAPLYEMKVRVPKHIVMEGTINEGYLIYRGESWFLSPDKPNAPKRDMFLLFVELCDPLKDIIVI